MQIEVIKLADMMPDANNPRKDFGDIEDLADSFMFNKLHPCEPMTPPMVVRDGNVYRINDGERRYRAMLHLGTEECRAIVCEDDGEADSMLAMFATDDKKQLTDEERSAGVQQMLTLNIPFEQVDGVAHLKKGTAEKVRKVQLRYMAEDKAEKVEQFSIDRMIAMSDFMDEGDEEGMKKIAAVSEQSWRGVAEEHRKKRAREDAMITIRAFLDAEGVEYSEDRPSGDLELAYECRIDARQLEEFVSLIKTEGAYIHLDAGSYYDMPHVSLYLPEDGDEAAAEKAESRRREDELTLCLDHGSERRARWYAKAIEDRGLVPSGRLRKGEVQTPYVDTFIMDDLMQTGYSSWGSYVENFLEITGLSESDFPKEVLCGRFAMYAYMRARGELDTHWIVRELAEGECSSYAVKDVRKFVLWVDTCRKDGYEPDEADEMALDVCRKALANAPEDTE